MQRLLGSDATPVAESCDGLAGALQRDVAWRKSEKII